MILLFQKKILFVYGTRVCRDGKGQLYVGSGLDSAVWNRYIEIGKSLTFCGVIHEKKFSDDELCNNWNRLPMDKISFVEYKKQNTIKKKLNGYTYRSNKRILQEQIDKHDIVILRVPTEMANFVHKYTLKQKKTLIVEVVGCPFDALWNHSLKGKAIAIPSMFSMKKLVKYSPNVIYVSNKFLQMRYPTKGNGIGCSDVRLENINDLALKERLEKIKGKNQFVIGTIGGYNVKFKCQDKVFLMLAYLKNRGIVNIRYELVGGGDNWRLKQLAQKYGVEEQVCFIGSLSHELVFDWLDKIDCYIQPSKQEGLPRSVVEAMSRGLPCIGSTVGGIPELLEADMCFKHGKRMVEQMGDRVKELLEDYDYYARVARRNFEQSKLYDTNKLEERRKQFIYSILKGEM